MKKRLIFKNIINLRELDGADVTISSFSLFDLVRIGDGKFC